MTEYRVAVTLSRPLEDTEVRQLHTNRSSSVSGYDMDGGDVVMVSLHAPNALTAAETAEIQVQRATGVEIAATQLVP
ncbi:hypothetical protein [Nesterenkonia sp. Act20]|uniref:hypothetical protein n=1 Tax=Nesterenkonia sp. Act20 TaxID=1483432 RepID=UPI001C4833B8|nr:hypothetical protein [Nesterenkonia sp. Act20]